MTQGSGKPDTPPTLFWVSGSPYSWRVLLTLEAKGLAYRSRILTKAEGGLNAPELAKINPHRTVPTLQDGDLVITDSIGILAYLERLTPAPPLFGDTTGDAGTIWQQIFLFIDHVEPHSKPIVKTFYAGKSGVCRNEIDAHLAALHSELARMDAALGRDWLAGDQVTAADFVAYPFLKSLFRAAARPEAQSHILKLLPVGTRYPAIAAWMKRVEALPFMTRLTRLIGSVDLDGHEPRVRDGF